MIKKLRLKKASQYVEEGYIKQSIIGRNLELMENIEINMTYFSWWGRESFSKLTQMIFEQ